MVEVGGEEKVAVEEASRGRGSPPGRGSHTFCSFFTFLGLCFGEGKACSVCRPAACLHPCLAHQALTWIRNEEIRKLGL